MKTAQDVFVPTAAETALRRAEDHLRESEERYRALAGSVAHEFNNLLTVISGYANLLSEDLESDNVARAKIDQILGATARAKELTSKLLVISGKHPHESSVQIDGAVARGGNEPVLVVDDEEVVRALTVAVLVRLGYRIVAATTAADALRRVRDGLRFDLIVTDVVMPDMKGDTLVAALRTIVSEFEVLYVSGFAASTDDAALHADPLHFLAKPFTAEELARKVRGLLDKAGKAGKAGRAGRAGRAGK